MPDSKFEEWFKRVTRTVKPGHLILSEPVKEFAFWAWSAGRLRGFQETTEFLTKVIMDTKPNEG